MKLNGNGKMVKMKIKMVMSNQQTNMRVDPPT